MGKISNMIKNQNHRIDVNLLKQIIFVLDYSVKIILSDYSTNRK